MPRLYFKDGRTLKEDLNATVTSCLGEMDSLLWLWKFSSQKDGDDERMTPVIQAIKEQYPDEVLPQSSAQTVRSSQVESGDVGYPLPDGSYELTETRYSRTCAILFGTHETLDEGLYRLSVKDWQTGTYDVSGLICIGGTTHMPEGDTLAEDYEFFGDGNPPWRLLDLRKATARRPETGNSYEGWAAVVTRTVIHPRLFPLPSGKSAENPG
jgi:hypothetical protein